MVLFFVILALVFVVLLVIITNIVIVPQVQRQRVQARHEFPE